MHRAEPPFANCFTTMDEVRELVPAPDQPAVRKDIDHVDVHCRAFIARSPFVVIASAGADGSCDASPKGGDPGFVKVLDDRRLAIPDYPGNRRLDSWANILATGRLQLIFLIPGVLETLRISGRGYLTRDPALLRGLDDRGRTPKLALGVAVEVAFLHCGKALRRSSLWDAQTWPSREERPSAARALADHIAMPGVTAEAVEHHLAVDYQANLWPPEK
jgi:PPOX class probable FMN-dependent enzyme